MKKKLISLLILACLGILLAAPSANAAENDGKYKHRCPPGTIPFGAPPPAGKKLWCRQPVKGGGFIRQGKFAAFYPNGRKQVDGNFVSNKQHGTWTSFDRQGRKLTQSVFYDGKEIKKMKFDRSGKPVEVKPKERQRSTGAQLNDWSGQRELQRKRKKR